MGQVNMHAGPRVGSLSTCAVAEDFPVGSKNLAAAAVSDNRRSTVAGTTARCQP